MHEISRELSGDRTPSLIEMWRSVDSRLDGAYSLVFLNAVGDMLIVRELVGGLYFGASGVREDGTAFDTCEYTPAQIERVVRKAFRFARSRRGHLISVDKANVLETSRLWRRVVDSVAGDYADVRVEHMLVDNAAMQLATNPERFDVLVTENMFGDILSDLAAAVTGGLGLAPSASLSDGGPGIFEPVHGSAPDITGEGIANPTAMLRSTALLLEHGLGLAAEAERLSLAVEEALKLAPTPDMKLTYRDGAGSLDAGSSSRDRVRCGAGIHLMASLATGRTCRQVN
jgi:3-isopropylmalate dehydrogenase